MEPINETIKIPPSISPLLVLGEKDCVFNAIRKVTDCKLRYQPEDESFAVYGDPRDVDKLKDIFEEIFSRIFRDENVSKSDIGVICNIVNQRPEDTDETVILSYHGKQVRTKTKGQLEYVRSMRENDITICVAPPGSSKTYSAVAYGLNLLRNKDVDKIIITRPLVEAGGEEVGIEPGTITEKLYNWMLPCLDVFERVLGKSQLEKYIEDGKIQMLPLGRMRGLSFYHSFCIADEMQNSSITLAKLIATRIGEGSKIVICGDPMQRDFRSESGLDYLARSLDGISGVGVIRMSDADVVRHGLIPKILKAFEDTDKQAEREFKRQMSQGFGIPIQAGVQPVSMHIGGPGSIIA